MLRPIEVRKGARYHVAVLELPWIGHRLEKPAPYDLEALLGACGSPRGLKTADHVTKPIKSFAPTLAAYLYVIGLRVWRTRGVGGGKASTNGATVQITRLAGFPLGRSADFSYV